MVGAVNSRGDDFVMLGLAVLYIHTYIHTSLLIKLASIDVSDYAEYNLVSMTEASDMVI